ncbi:MAG: hypothetical protein HY854_08960 [Burkholderiales bacterium]|nr:hypothetical protein [Burkholderiales bacterium]
MRIAEHVGYAIDHMEQGKFDPALLHACIAIDATAKRLYPTEKRVRVRYVRCLRDYYWLIEPMLGAGINLVDTKWGNVPLSRTPTPDWAEVVYEIFRCSHAHGDEVPPEFSVEPLPGQFQHRWRFGRGELHMPTTVVFALIGVAVVARVNEREKIHKLGTYYLTLGRGKYIVDEWWGREDDFRPIADKENQVRVTIEGLTPEGWAEEGPSGGFAVIQPGYEDMYERAKAEAMPPAEGARSEPPQ